MEANVRRVYVTQNSEYHVHGDRCVAVRDRRSGRFLPEHSAVDRRLAGAVLLEGGGLRPMAGAAPVGGMLCFDDGHLMTSPILAVSELA